MIGIIYIGISTFRPGSFGKQTLFSNNNSLSINLLLLLILGVNLLSCIPSALSSSSTKSNVTINNVHHRHHSSAEAPHTATNHTSNSSTPIGQPCEQDAECTNFSICQDKEFEDNLVIRICQCDPLHANRLEKSCFVKPGHQCYFPNLDKHGRRSLNCMPETECRSGVHRTAPSNGYCMCLDQNEDEPFRPLNVRKEIDRCQASKILSHATNGILMLVVAFSSYIFAT
ncbi:uncharacterized protein LOC110844933 [Folsomia candida]|uniref:Uncharacterized protein n=1 Tax=Folsomia candida TaxID=158441 RepID=A0A226ESL9_FOLCA|nr:uncharacterized protein LOC110844933 [Folsomia candida]OXA60167.1 hypothetical protein Fcan01_06035 [Folsomia candida]